MRKKTSFLFVVLPFLAAWTSQEAGKEIGRLNHEGLEAYDSLEFEAAKQKLLAAVKIATDEGLIEDRIVARTYLHLGAVYIAGWKDLERGAQAMQRALRIDPQIKMTPSITNKQVVKAFEQAKADLAAEKAAVEAKIAQKAKELAEKEAAERARVEKLLADRAAAKAAKDAAARKAGEEHIADQRKKAQAEKTGEVADVPAPAPDPKAPPALAESVDTESVEGLRCPAAGDLPPRRPLALRCALDKTVDAAAVFAFYRPVGRDDFTPQIMKKSPKGWWETVLAPELIQSPGVEIYFEARDKKGKPLAADGNAGTPKTLSVKTASALAQRARMMADADE